MRILLFLVDTSIHLQDSAGHVYVEVVLHGKTEGRFLEDLDAHRKEMMGQVSKLGGFYRCVAKRETYRPLIEISSLLDPRRHIFRSGEVHWSAAGRSLED